MCTKINRGKTAIKRTVHSRPVQLALDEGLIGKTTTVLDYGCGRGDDVRMLRRRRIQAHGWDPVQPKAKYCVGGKSGLVAAKALGPYDAVNLGFVLNVIEDPKERDATLRKAWRLTKKVLLVAVRVTGLPSGAALQREAVNRLDWEKHGDGVVTSIGTFQKFYSHAEFREYLTRVLERTPIMAAPGVAYVFRSRSLERLYLTLRYPRPGHGPSTAPKGGKEKKS